MMTLKLLAPVSLMAASLMAGSLMAAATTSLSSMKWDKRVLLVSAPAADDPSVIEQRRIVAGWQKGADERDLAIVTVVGGAVSGASDAAPAIRRRYGLPTAGFSVVLIGKDGGIKLRETRPIPAAVLETTIDAMPMRRRKTR